MRRGLAPAAGATSWTGRRGTFELTADDRFTLLSGLSHDPVLRDIFTPLSLGASLHIPAQADADRARRAGGLVRRGHAPTAAHMTPPLGLLLTAGRGRPRWIDLRYVFWGGDVLRRGARRGAGGARAELPRASTSTAPPRPRRRPAASACQRGFAEDRAPIGAGIDGFALEIRDEDACRCATGEPGEIVVRSQFLTLGSVEDGVLPWGRAACEMLATRPATSAIAAQTARSPSRAAATTR